MLILAFDTATHRATSALVRNGEVLGEGVSAPSRVLADVDDLLRDAGLEQADVGVIAVGTGPGSFTGIRIGLAAARGLAYSLQIPVAGVSTLDALAAGAPGAVPVIDARRREVFVLMDEPLCISPSELVLDPGTRCVGDGAVHYRDLLQERGLEVPPDDSPLHVPWARHHATLARDYGDAGDVQPIYLRLPDAVVRASS
jgi:tRNA threonylcarbamoyladenosine biosynthesis protein TsaB